MGEGREERGGRDMGRLVYVWYWTIKGQSRGRVHMQHHISMHVHVLSHPCATLLTSTCMYMCIHRVQGYPRNYI